MFADPIEMGYDPSVYKVPGSSTYVFSIEDNAGGNHRRYFRTVKPILEPRQICITGRSTRVVEAQEVYSFQNPTPIPDARTYVLREAWIEQDAKTERQIQVELFADLKAFGDQLLVCEHEPDQFIDFGDDMKAEIRDIFSRYAYKDYFLTIACDSVGYPSKAVAPGCAEVEDVFDPDPKKQWPIRQINTSPTEPSSSDGSISARRARYRCRP